MALAKVTVVDKREVLEDGTLQVRRATYIEEDGVRIAGPIYERVTYVPGTVIAGEDVLVTRVAAAEWTPAVVQAYRDKMAAGRG